MKTEFGRRIAENEFRSRELSPRLSESKAMTKQELISTTEGNRHSGSNQDKKDVQNSTKAQKRQKTWKIREGNPKITNRSTNAKSAMVPIQKVLDAT